MKKYYVKPHFSGWHEVNEEQYRAFIKTLREGSSNIPNEKKDDLIAKRTKVVELIY